MKSNTGKGKRKGNAKKKFRGQYDAKLKRDNMEADEVAFNEKRDKRSCPNDWQWYAQSPQLVKDYASFPFGDPLGNTLRSGLGKPFTDISIPGICSIYFTPAIGNAVDANSPINVAARNIYSYVRHVNSGHSNYDAPDLMLYLLAMDSCYMYNEFLKRIARIVLDYSVFTRYYPDGLMVAMGVDPVDVQKNIAKLRGFINIMATKLGSMCVPNSMSYTARHMWMAGSLFLDSNTTKAQTYVYVPSAYLQFGFGGESGTVGLVKAIQAPGNFTGVMTSLATVDDLISFANTLMDPILSNEDMNIMSGDILKAFGDAGVVKLAGITEGEALLPSKIDEVLSQIENAVVMPIEFSSYVIQQNTAVGGGFLYPSGIATSTHTIKSLNGSFLNLTPNALTTALQNNFGSTVMYNTLLNFHWDNVQPEDVMVATRLTTIPQFKSVSYVKGEDTFSVTWDLRGVSSEVVTGGRLWALNRLVQGQPTVYTYIDFMKYNFVSQVKIGSTGVPNPLTAANWMAQFDWAPDMMSYIVNDDNNANGVLFPAQLSLRDTDNYTFISADELESLATVALLSEFSVPQMGTFSKKI